MGSPQNPSTVNIQSATRFLPVGDKLMEHHYYTRFIQPKTELWLFGVGLGDQAIMQQLGESFLEMPDPSLGRIMVSLGITATALYPYKGDFNVWWAWGDRPNWLEYYLSKTTVKPDLCLCPSKHVLNKITDAKLEAIYCPLGVGERFKPLHLQRFGLAYTGSDAKTPEQKDLILNPFLNRNDFVWHSKRVSDEYFTLDKLNEWYNTKQILFGMVNEHCSILDIVPNRVYETLASGTPLIMPAHTGFAETFGFKQPYGVEKLGDAERYVDRILCHYAEVQRFFEGLSVIMHKQHSYTKRLQTMFQRLRELKR